MWGQPSQWRDAPRWRSSGQGLSYRPTEGGGGADREFRVSTSPPFPPGGGGVLNDTRRGGVDQDLDQPLPPFPWGPFLNNPLGSPAPDRPTAAVWGGGVGGMGEGFPRLKAASQPALDPLWVPSSLRGGPGSVSKIFERTVVSEAGPPGRCPVPYLRSGPLGAGWLGGWG